jgi:hypothetical protein
MEYVALDDPLPSLRSRNRYSVVLQCLQVTTMYQAPTLSSTGMRKLLSAVEQMGTNKSAAQCFVLNYERPTFPPTTWSIRIKSVRSRSEIL